VVFRFPQLKETFALGHAKLADTTVYLQLLRRHQQAVATPLKAIEHLLLPAAESAPEA